MMVYIESNGLIYTYSFRLGNVFGQALLSFSESLYSFVVRSVTTGFLRSRFCTAMQHMSIDLDNLINSFCCVA